MSRVAIGETRVPRPVATTALAWVAMVGIDLLLHAGILAPFYDWESPFLLAPVDAFLRIPAGYLAFAVLAAALVWLLPRLGVEGGRGGAVVGGAVGAVGWGALLLGTWSISTAEPQLLLAWWIGQSASMAGAGFAIGAAIADADRGRLWLSVGAVLVVGVVTAIVLQSIGYAAAPVIIR